MPWWARLLLEYAAPVVAEAVLALIRGIEANGNTPAPALMVAVDVVRGLEHSVVPLDERHGRAHAAIASHLRHESGVEPSTATVNALLEVALQTVRNEPAL